MTGRRRRAGERIGRALAAITVASWRDGPRLTAALVAVTLGLGLYAASQLGVNADNRRLLSPDLPFQADDRAFEQRFPALSESLLVVIDAETPELAREATAQLGAALAARSERFSDVFAPGSEPFFEVHGLLYRSAEDLEDFGDHLARLQPLLAGLSADPSLGALTRLIERGLSGGSQALTVGVDLPAVLERFGAATVEVYAEHPVALSWEDLVLEGSRFDGRRRRVLVAEPRLDYERILPASQALAEVRDAAVELGLEPERGVRVRITGYPALNDEEMRGLVTDVGVAGIFSFAGVGALLALALRWGRFVAAAAGALAVGLVWTAAFAAAAVGDLNLVSIAFAVLFIGLGADFAIHLGLHWIETGGSQVPQQQALSEATRDVGNALLLCTLTTAIGFFAFVPTDYRGVGELGLIAGFGMLAILVLTLTLLPALVGESRPDTSRQPLLEARLRASVAGFAERRPRSVVGVAAVLLLGAAALAPSARFDSNVVALRDPGTESVEAFEDLLEEDASPWTIEVMAADPEAAARRAARIRGLPTVESARTLSDYVPADQDEKLEILADLRLLFDAPSVSPATNPPDAAQRIEALRSLAAALEVTALLGKSDLADSARRLRDVLREFLARVEEAADPEPELARLEAVLLGRFPERMERLQRALATGPVVFDDLPPNLVRRFRAADGTERIQVFPREDLGDAGALARFVADVRRLEPHASGLPVSVVEFGYYTSKSLREAFAGALLAIAVLLMALWGRPTDVALALAPVMSAALLTVGTLAALDRPFNFANVIVLPLLLGVGVDSGVHLVRRARRSPGAAFGESATNRAVLYSALTTLVSFGSLAFTRHRGIASLGFLLVIGMIFTLAANLVLLPALLVLTRKRSG